MERLISVVKKDLRDWRDLAPLEGLCKIVDVYDGDTCWAAIDLANPSLNPDIRDSNIKKVNIRIARINAPEIKGGTETTRASARASRDFARSLLLGKIIRFRFGNFGLINGESLDCYHRQIAELYILNDDFIKTTLKDLSAKLIVGGSNLIPSNTEYINFSDIMLLSGNAELYQPKD